MTPWILEVLTESTTRSEGDAAEGPARVVLARQLNCSIHEIGRRLTARGDEDFDLTFFCQCGCLRPITLTLAGFEAAGGAWLEGHPRPDSGSG
jgi:hypothetical protein